MGLIAPDVVHYSQTDVVHATYKVTLDQPFRHNTGRFAKNRPSPPRQTNRDVDQLADVDTGRLIASPRPPIAPSLEPCLRYGDVTPIDSLHSPPLSAAWARLAKDSAA